jgi:hypothetical protein
MRTSNFQREQQQKLILRSAINNTKTEYFNKHKYNHSKFDKKKKNQIARKILG